MMKELWITFRLFFWMTLLTGLLYPLIITGFAMLGMEKKASGDFVLMKDRVVGSKLIAQKFEGSNYFWGRPSSIDYNPLPSGGSNLGPTSLDLKKAVDERVEKILRSHGTSKERIPSELLFASGSGLDPHISIDTAYFQMDRIARSRGVKSEDVKNLIDQMAIHSSLGVFGSPHVNVLMLNIALDEKFNK